MKEQLDENRKTTRCTECAAEFTDKEIEGHYSCPKCGTQSIPCAISDDVSININWHELRILVIWAENWAKYIDDKEKANPDHKNMLLTIMIIAERLQKQFPNKTKLTLFSEIRELRKMYNLETNIDNDDNLGLDK